MRHRPVLSRLVLWAATGAAASIGTANAWAQATVPPGNESDASGTKTGTKTGTRTARSATENELGVPDYLGLRPAGAPNRTVTRPVPNAGVANDFQGLQAMGGATPMGGVVPYLGGGGGAGMIPPGVGISWGTGFVSLSSGVSFMYTDNATQSLQGSGEDFVISPMIGIDASQMVTENAMLTLSTGVGYRYSMNYDDLTQISLLPSGSLNYSLVVGDVLITLFDRVSSPANIRHEIVGAGSSAGVDFNRIMNQAGVSAAWAITEDTSLTGMYGYTMDVGLSDRYGILDSSAHTVSSAVFQRLSPYWSVGVSGNASKQSFSQGFQNGSTSYGAGPVVSFRPNRFITANAGLQYTIVEFNQSGSTGDRSEFNGLTWQGSVQHVLTDRINHAVTFSSGVNSGLGSNFTDTTGVNYTLGWLFMDRMGLNASFDYTHFKQSSRADTLIVVATPNGLFGVPVTIVSNDEASQYTFNIGTGLQISDRINTSLSYSWMKRDSRFSERSFTANTVTLFVNFRF